MNFADMKKWILGVKGQKAQLVEAIEKKKRRREDLASMLMSKPDAVRLLDRFVEQLGDEYPERLMGSLSHLLRNPLKRTADQAGVFAMLPVLTAAGQGVAASSPRPLEASLTFLFADEIKQGLRRAVAKMNLPDGPTLEEREAEIAKLDQEIASHERELEELVSEARQIVSDL